MEHPPADARAAPSASVPNDTVMDIASSPKRPRDPAQDNRVSQSATPFDPALLEIHVCTTECLLREHVRACQSLAHHTTPMGRCRKSVDNWAPPCEGPQSRSTTTKPAERLGKSISSAIHTGSCPPLQLSADDTSTQKPRPGHIQHERTGSTLHHHSTSFRRDKNCIAARARPSMGGPKTDSIPTAHLGLRHSQYTIQSHHSPPPSSSE